MDNVSSWHSRMLRERLKTRADNAINNLSHGHAADYAAYREKVAYIRAFGDAIAMSEEIERDYQKDVQK